MEIIKKSTLPKGPYAIAAHITLRKLSKAELCAASEDIAP